MSDSWENAIDAQARINIMKEGGRALEDILIVKGAQPIAEFYRNMLARAKSHVLHMSVPYDTVFDALSGDALAKAGNKVKVRVLTSIEKDTLQMIRAIEERSEVRHIDAKAGINITLVDDEILLTPAAGSRGQSAIWSSVRDYVEHYSTMFDSLWSSSTAMADRVAVIEAQEKVSRLVSSMRLLLEGAGLKIQKDLKGASGLVHEFSMAAAGERGTVIVDIAAPDKDLQTAVIGFLVKCMDVRADHKVLVTLADPSVIKAPTRSLQSDVTIVSADDAEQMLRKLVARLQPAAV